MSSIDFQYEHYHITQKCKQTASIYYNSTSTNTKILWKQSVMSPEVTTRGWVRLGKLTIHTCNRKSHGGNNCHGRR